jgi:hypothetical protein
MNRLGCMLVAAALALTVVGAAQAREDDIDVNRLSGSLAQLATTPPSVTTPSPSRPARGMRSTGWPRRAGANEHTRCTWPSVAWTWPRPRRSCRTPRPS